MHQICRENCYVHCAHIKLTTLWCRGELDNALIFCTK